MGDVLGWLEAREPPSRRGFSRESPQCSEGERKGGEASTQEGGWAGLRADERLRPSPRLPARPSCSWGWEEEHLGTRAGREDPCRAEGQGDREGVGHRLLGGYGCPLSQWKAPPPPPRACIQGPSQLLGTTRLLRNPPGQEPRSLCQPELKVGSGAPSPHCPTPHSPSSPATQRAPVRGPPGPESACAV